MNKIQSLWSELKRSLFKSIDCLIDDMDKAIEIVTSLEDIESIEKHIEQMRHTIYIYDKYTLALQIIKESNHGN